MTPRAGAILLQALLIVAAWTLLALFSASQNYLSRGYAATIEWSQALRYASLDAYSWAILTPFVFWVGGRLVLRRRIWMWALPLLVLAGFVFGLLHLYMFIRLLPWIGYTNSQR